MSPRGISIQPCSRMADRMHIRPRLSTVRSRFGPPKRSERRRLLVRPPFPWTKNLKRGNVQHARLHRRAPDAAVRLLGTRPKIGQRQLRGCPDQRPRSLRGWKNHRPLQSRRRKAGHSLLGGGFRAAHPSTGSASRLIPMVRSHRRISESKYSSGVCGPDAPVFAEIENHPGLERKSAALSRPAGRVPEQKKRRAPRLASAAKRVQGFYRPVQIKSARPGPD